MTRIRVLTRCVADRYADKDRERTIEFMDPRTGKGGLLNFRRASDDGLEIFPYQLDEGVVVLLGKHRRPDPRKGDTR